MKRYILFLILARGCDPLIIEVPDCNHNALGDWMHRANEWADRTGIPFRDRPHGACGPTEIFRLPPAQLARD